MKTQEKPQAHLFATLLPKVLLILLTVGLCLSAAAPARAAQLEESAVLGDTLDYTLIHEITLENTAAETATDITVRIPLMDQTTPLYSLNTGTEYTPFPQQIIMDQDGHLYAVYFIDTLPGHSAVVLSQRYAMNISALSYGFDPAGVAAEYAPYERNLYSRELAAAPGIDAESERILSFVKAKTAALPNPYQKARALFSSVNLLLTYSEKQADQSAAAVFERGSANCEGYTNLYLACLRAAGIPARQISGYLYQPDRHVSAEYVDMEQGRIRLNGLRHTWVEFYLPSLGWLVADPTFTYTFPVDGKEQKFVDWSYFAGVSSKNRYLYFRTGSTETDTISLTATGGKVKVQFNAYLNNGHNYVPFTDIRDHWAREAITYCVEHNLFNGVSLTSFAPDRSMTRAMFVTVLGRLAEAQGHIISGYPQEAIQLDDVDFNAYYIKYLGWALEHNLISGYGNRRFGPNDPITREQMASIMAKFVALLGLQTGSSQLLFSDSFAISPWAQSGVDFCSSAHLITGYTDGSFRPRDYASRAQVAAIMQRLDTLILNWNAARKEMNF